jgi:hypothetical protein
MKTIISLIFTLLLVSNAFAYKGVWSYGAVQTNPTTSTVFVSATLPASGSTASPGSANYAVGMHLYCSIQETYLLEVFNASAVLQTTIPYVCSATAPNIIPTMNVSFPIQDGWTIKIVPAVGFTGSGSAQLFYAIESLN